MSAEMVDIHTGEVLDGNDRLPQLRTIQQLARSPQEAAVTECLSQANAWLSRAISEPETPAALVSDARCAVAMAREACKQREIGNDTRLNAEVVCRLAEYALGRAIRFGQERGEISRIGTQPNGRSPYQQRHGERLISVSGSKSKLDFDPAKPTDFATGGQTLHQIYALSDEVAPSEFKTQLSAARSEEKLSALTRSAMVRRVKALHEDEDKPGETSELVPRKTNRKSDEVLERIVLSVESFDSVLPLVDFATVTPEHAEAWLERLDEATKTIALIRRNLRKATK